MNTRLDALYTSIEKQNTDKFLNNQLEIDVMWGKPIWGATLQIDLSESARDALCGYQNELDALEPNSLLLLPRQFQHISVNQVVFWGGNYQLGTKETWEQIAENFISSFKNLKNTLPPFEVKFQNLLQQQVELFGVRLTNTTKWKNYGIHFYKNFPFRRKQLN